MNSMKDRFADCPKLLRDFLFYLQTIKGRSIRTVDGYYIDLRGFLRFLLQLKDPIYAHTDISEIKIDSVDADFLKNVTLSDIYEYLNYTMASCNNNAKTRSRKVSSIRSFFKYLTITVNVLQDNPAKNIETPSVKKSLPKYLSLEESLELLNQLQSRYDERDFCILTLFLNCGMRLSELVGINLQDIKDNTVRLLGKGNKERQVYLNDACLSAIDRYLKVRLEQFKPRPGEKALFLSRLGNRITTRRVQQIVEQALKDSGLDNKGYSTHKLRHTAATLMYQYGGVDIRILKEILGHANLATTEIYTHVSDRQLQNAASSSPLSKVTKKEKKE